MDSFENAVVVLALECGHTYSLKLNNFEILRKLAKKHNKTFRDNDYCYKCNKKKV